MTISAIATPRTDFGASERQPRSGGQLLLEFRDLLRNQARHRGELVWRTFLQDVEVKSWDASLELLSARNKNETLRDLQRLTDPASGPAGPAEQIDPLSAVALLGRQLVLGRITTEMAHLERMGVAPEPVTRRRPDRRRSPVRRLLARHEALTRKIFARAKAELWLTVARRAVLEADHMAGLLRVTCSSVELDALRSELAAALSIPNVGQPRWDDLEACAEEIGARRLVVALEPRAKAARVVRRLLAP